MSESDLESEQGSPRKRTARSSGSDSSYTLSKRRHRRPRKLGDDVEVVVATRCKPGFSADDPISILSDDDLTVQPSDETAEPTESKIEFSKNPVKVVWKVLSMRWGAELYGFKSDGSPVLTVTFTNEFFEFKACGDDFPGVCVNLKDRPKPFEDISCNTFHSPCFIAFRPSARGISGLSTTDTRSFSDLDHRYFVLYFDKSDDGRAVLLRDTLAKLSPKIDNVIHEIPPEELSRFDGIYPRPSRGRTRSSTLKTVHDAETSFTKRINAKKPILQYPIAASTGNRITLTEDDLDVLDPGNFLNDSIVDFYLLYLKDRFDCDRVHIFNSFFYKKYTSAGSAPSAGQAECYKAVKSWTRNVDLFQKDFLIMPVCDKMHWSCVIACHPGRLRQAVSLDADEPVFPCVLLLDSLGSHSGPKLFRMFRNYLASEWNERHPDAEDEIVERLRITPEKMPGIVVHVPKQTNDCDCGLFLLQYVEEFLANPFSDFRKPHIHKPDWFPSEHVVQEKREALRKLVIELSGDWKAFMSEQNRRMQQPSVSQGSPHHESSAPDDGAVPFEL